MRFIVLLLLLVGLMAAAGLWQQRWTHAARQQRDLLLGRTRLEPSPPPSARLVLGRPSRQAPFDVPLGLPPALPDALALRGVPGVESPAPPDPAWEYAPQPWEPVFEVEIRPGQVLSVLCSEFYGTSRPPVVRRVAEWNGLTNPDQLRAGQRIELPGRAWVLAEAP